METKNMETKSERFVRLAEPRVSRACKAVSLLANLASSQYEYTEKQVDTMFAAIEGQSPGGALGGHFGAAIWPEKDKDTTGESPTRAGTHTRRSGRAASNRRRRRLASRKNDRPEQATGRRRRRLASRKDSKKFKF